MWRWLLVLAQGVQDLPGVASVCLLSGAEALEYSAAGEGDGIDADTGVLLLCYRL